VLAHDVAVDMQQI